MNLAFNQSRHWLWLPVWVCLAVARARAETRVALVSTCGGEAGQNVLALADAALSADTNIALVERREIERVLQEQKLMHCGLSEAEQAVTVGRLLGAQIFASLETVPNEKEALGLVVFDAGTGVVLEDSILPTGDIQQTAAAVVAAVKFGNVKRQRQAGALTTVCILSVRNADLPREFDSLCESVGGILQRQLVQSPSLAVLERHYLEHVNRERSLPMQPQPNQLLASLVMIELEVGRGSTAKSLTAVASLSDNTGAKLGRAAVVVESGNPADLSDQLMAKLETLLKAAPPHVVVDRAREAERFGRETKALWSYGEHFRALETAEAAYALQPTADFQAVLARSLIDCGIQILRPEGQFMRGRLSRHVIDDDIRRSLAIAQRAARYGAVMPPTAASTNRPETAEIADNLRYTAVWLKRYIEDILQVCRPDSYELFANEGWETLCLPLQAYLINGRSPQIDDAIESCHASWRNSETDQMLRSILELYRTSIFKFDALVAARVKPADPQVDSLDGLVARFHQEAPRLSREESVERVRRIRLSAQELILDAKSKHLGAPFCLRIETRVGEALMLVRSADAVEGEYAAFLEFLLQQGEFPPTLFIEPALASPLHCRDLSAEEYRRWLAVMDRVLELVNAPDCHLDASQRDRIRAETEYGRYRLLRLHSPAESAGPMPWTTARVLLECRNKKPGLVRFCSPYVSNENVYVMVLGPEADSPKNHLQLLRCSLVNGQVDYLSKVVVAEIPSRLMSRVQPRGSIYHYEPAETACLYEGRYFASPGDGSGIWMFPVDGVVGTRITTHEGLPSDEVDALACLDGELYAGLGGGYLVAYDLKTSSCDVLASSRRKEKLSPFDDGPPFSVRYLVADPPRHRIVFVAASYSGIWEFTPSNRAFKMLVPLILESNGPFWGSAVVDDHFILQTDRGSMVFDLRNNTASVLTRGLRSFPSVGDIYAQAVPRDQTNNVLGSRPRLLYPPLMVCGNWLWSASPWGRISLDGQRQEVFAPLRGDSGIGDLFYPTECLQTVGDGHQVLVGDKHTLWLLTLSEHASKVSP